MNDPLTLRLVTVPDLPVIESLTWDPQIAGEFAQFGWFDLRRWRRRWEEDEMIGPEGGMLMVARADETLGLVNWRRQQGTPASWYWQLGIALLPQARGRGHGTQAHRMLARYLFAHSTVHRIEASTEVGNVAEQRALEKAGFTREGVARGVGWRDGAWRDGVTFSLLRTDPAV